MILTQRGVLPPVNFLELDAALRSSILGPSGTRLITQADIARQLNQFTNAGAVTVLAANTVIVTSGAQNFAVGDLLWIDAVWAMTKGGVAGDCTADIRFTSGTGTLQFIDQSTIHAVRETALPNAAQWQGHACGMARCTVAGSVTIDLNGTSAGSNSTVGISGAGLGLFRI